MEKLIELLNEYKEEKNIYNTDMDGQLEIGNYRYVSYPCAERLCSKKYGFIKWLVDNNKIDFNKDAFVSLASELGCTAYDEKIVLMVLSISDTPIDDLISYLK